MVAESRGVVKSRASGRPAASWTDRSRATTSRPRSVVRRGTGSGKEGRELPVADWPPVLDGRGRAHGQVANAAVSWIGLNAVPCGLV